MPRAWPTAALLLLAVVRTASAQGPARLTSTIDLGASSLRWEDGERSSAFTLTPELQWERGLATVGVSGSFSRFGGGAWSTQGEAAASRFTRARGPLRGELIASAGGSAHEDGSGSGALRALGRAHVGGARAGAWAGLGAGRTHDGIAWRTLAQGELAAWARREALTAVVTLAPSRLGDSLRYTDVIASAQWARGRFESALSIGRRAGDRVFQVDRRTWGDLSATAWLLPRVAIAGAIGTYPLEPTQGFPGGSYASIALRFAHPPRVLETWPIVGAVRAEPAAADPAAISIEVRSAAERRTIRVRAPGAGAVEIAADFTDWRPVMLAREGDDWWTITRAIPAGPRQLNVRTNGGPWLVPRGATPVADEFGGTVGVIQLP